MSMARLDTNRKSSFVPTLVVGILTFLLAGCADDKPQQQDSSTTSSTTQQSASKSSSKGDLENIYMVHPTLSKPQVFAKYFKNLRGHQPTVDQCLAAADKANDNCDYESEVVLATEAIRLNPSCSEAYYQRARGTTYSPKADDSAALADFTQVVALPESKIKPGQRANAYSFMARIYDSRKQPKEAVDAMNKAIKLAPLDVSLYKARAAILVAQGDNEKAKKDYDEWIRLGPTDILPLLLRGQLFESTNRYEEALKDYDKASTMPERKDSLSKRDMSIKSKARVQAKLGKHKDAIATLTKAIEQEQSDDETLVLRAAEFAALKQYKEALKDYTQAIEMAPGFAVTALEGRSKVYAAMGQHDLAEKDTLEAKKMREAPAEKQLYEIK